MIREIKRIQNILGVEETGTIDSYTKAAIKNYQLRVGLSPTGELDDKTYARFLLHFGQVEEVDNVEPTPGIPDFGDEDNATTDLSENNSQIDIDVVLLPKTEYVSDQGKAEKKYYIFLHHTAGWNNPYAVIKDWATDTRGRVGTHYVIGGINLKNDDDQYDGKIVQCIPDDYFAFHLGSTSTDKINTYMHKHSIGIEICNFGGLTKQGNNYLTYTGQIVNPKYVEDLGYNFRGYRYWHKYTDKQLESLSQLIRNLSIKYDIDIRIGLNERLTKMTPQNAFDFYTEARDGKILGLLSHTSVRKDKSDVSPQKKLVDMIKSL